MILGAHHRYLLPASVVAGAFLLTLADCAARLVVTPAELPIGLVTSLVGGPFFFWLLTRARSVPLSGRIPPQSNSITVERRRRTTLFQPTLALAQGRCMTLLGANLPGTPTFLT